MALSTRSLAPGYIRGTYSGALFPHHMNIPVNFSGTPVPGTMPTLLTKSGGTVAADVAYNTFLGPILPNFNNGTVFGLTEVHTVDATTGEDQFIFAWDANQTGLNTDPRVPTSQAVMTFKSRLGTLYRLYLMEGVASPGVKLLPPLPGTVFPAMVDYMLSDDSIVWARKNAYLFSVVSYITKLNDKLRKQQGLG